MMGLKSLLRAGYVVLVVQGLISVFAPKKAIEVATAGWRVGFENVDELDPREWYVELTRVLGVGMLAAGLTGLLVTDAEKQSAEAAVDADADGESADEDDGPVTVDIDE
jgi:hypothetical protein